jgi:hypothetical protein
MGPLAAVHPHSAALSRAGGHVPIIRHPHVTSSTHPHHIVTSKTHLRFDSISTHTVNSFFFAIHENVVILKAVKVINLYRCH